MTLPIIKSEEENEAYKPLYRKYPFWLGIQLNGSEWISDDGQALSYSNWMNNHPNSPQRNIYAQSLTDFFLNSSVCNIPRMPNIDAISGALFTLRIKCE